MLPRPIPATWALLSLGLAGCGARAVEGPPLGTLDEAVDEVAVRVGETDGAPSAALPPGCPFDLEAMKTRLPSVTATRADDPVATVQTVFEASDDEARLRAWYEVRDAVGHESGRVEYVCGPPGLALRRIEGSRGTISFEPPLLVLPAIDGEGETAGVAAVRADGVDTVLDARHAWATSATDAPVTAPRPGTGARRVTATLELGGDGHAWQIASESVWVLESDGTFWPATSERTVTVDDAEGVTHREETGSVVFVGDVPRW